jgi:hypothetical protein
MKKSQALKFLEKAEKDPKIRNRVIAAMERGGNVTADEVVQIANEFGFKITRSQLQKDAKSRMSERFDAGDANVQAVARTKPTTAPPKPPMSSCASGCLSWTKSYCPSR